MLYSYMARQWFDDEAVAWAKEWIDAGEAAVWKALGFRANEASRLVRKGVTLADTVRDWWQEGIPIGELADWIGAGLTPEEALRQRWEAVTGARGAAPRALQRAPYQ